MFSVQVTQPLLKIIAPYFFVKENHPIPEGATVADIYQSYQRETDCRGPEVDSRQHTAEINIPRVSSFSWKCSVDMAWNF